MLEAVGRAAEDDLAVAASRLLAEVAADRWGAVSPSVYETGRLVAIAPWLVRHAERLEFLCRSQHPDGGWGGPAGYAVVPTLSATAALLAELARTLDGGRRPPLVRAAQAGLRLVRRWREPGGWLDPGRGPALPDTVAAELIGSALLAELDGLIPEPLNGSTAPDLRALDALRARAVIGPPPPETVHHVLELLGPAAKAAPFVRLAEGGVGASAAATVSWLGGPAGPPAARRFLERLVARGGGTVPNVTPIGFFEAAWVLNSLAVGGLGVSAPGRVLDRLEAGLTGAGCPAGPGLPVDSDDTAAVLSALLRHGRPRAPEALLRFHGDGYFRCFVTERNPSVSANAHVLEALSLHLARIPQDRARFAGPAARAAWWLLEQQRPDGEWWDKWHASPYYATACCVLALSLHGGLGADAAIGRAVTWVLETQHPDGSWGRWHGTVEETAYAVHVLARAMPDPAVIAAVARSRAFLADPPPDAVDPPLWHGKDLYTPVAVVRAARLAALNLAIGYSRRRPLIPRARRSADIAAPTGAGIG